MAAPMILVAAHLMLAGTCNPAARMLEKVHG
jgi:hypothetical protein